MSCSLPRCSRNALLHVEKSLRGDSSEGLPYKQKRFKHDAMPLLLLEIDYSIPLPMMHGPPLTDTTGIEALFCVV